MKERIKELPGVMEMTYILIVAVVIHYIHLSELIELYTEFKLDLHKPDFKSKSMTPQWSSLRF